MATQRVQHGTILMTDRKTFSNALSEKVNEGWLIISSGYDGERMGWWAVVQKIEIIASYERD